MPIKWATTKLNTTKDVMELSDLGHNGVLVVGTDIDGMHNSGLAEYAKSRLSAKVGQPFGRSGRTFLLPTRDSSRRPLNLSEIKNHINLAKAEFANHPHVVFYISKIGCESVMPSRTEEERIAEIAPLFRGCPPNCIFPSQFKKYLRPEYPNGY